MDGEHTAGSETAGGTAGSEKTVAEERQAPSAPQIDDAVRKDLQSKAHAAGRKARDKEILAQLGATSLEEVRERLAAHQQAQDDAAAAAAAEREERSALASKLTAAERRVKDLEKLAARLDEMRGSVLTERVRTAGVAAGVTDAIDDFVANALRAVAWGEADELVITSLADPEQRLDSLEQLAEQIREMKPYLFPSGRTAGTGFVPAKSTTQPAHGADKLSSIRERARWGRQ